MFVIGYYMERKSLLILANLRKNLCKFTIDIYPNIFDSLIKFVCFFEFIAADEKSHQLYFLPKGFAFEYVSSPHFLGELIMYAGLVILTKFNPNLLSIFITMIVNQIFSALLTHDWYKQKFGKNYPKNRKAIIPFIL